MEFIDKILGKVGLARTGSKSYAKLWAMAQEASMFNNENLTKEYAQVPNIYKPIKAIADNVTQAELKFYRKSDDEEVKNNPELERIFSNPNPLMSFNELMEALAVFYYLHGECFVVYSESVGQSIGTKKLPAELWTFSPSHFKEIKGDGGQLVAWNFKNQAFNVEDVLFMRDFDPYNEIRGLSKLEPARNMIDIDWKSMVYNKAFFQNNAQAGVYLTTDNNLNKSQRERITEWWNKQHRGASNAFKTAVLEAGMKPVSASQNANEMQFIEQKKHIREELIGIWRVPKAMFSMTEDLNYATFMGQKKVFWTDTIMPFTNRLAEEFNAQFFNRFMPDIYCRFDYSNVSALQDDVKEKIECAKRLWDMGVPFNVLNEKFELGIDDIEGGDTGYVPFNLVPVNLTESVHGQPTEEPQKAIEKLEEPEDKRINGDFIWKSFLKKHTPLERKLESKVRRFFFEQRSRFLTMLLEAKSVKDKITKADLGFEINWDEETKLFIKSVSPTVWESVLQGADFAHSLVGGSVNDAVLTGKLRSFLAIREKSWAGIMSTTERDIKRIIQQSVEEGETVQELSDRLRTAYNNLTPRRAKVIARTETTSALNGGSMQYYDTIGAKSKTWITAGDEHVRDSHTMQHGMTIAMNERFPNGLEYPSSDGDASEVVNCRCTLVSRDSFVGEDE